MFRRNIELISRFNNQHNLGGFVGPIKGGITSLLWPLGACRSQLWFKSLKWQSLASCKIILDQSNNQNCVWNLKCLRYGHYIHMLEQATCTSHNHPNTSQFILNSSIEAKKREESHKLCKCRVLFDSILWVSKTNFYVALNLVLNNVDMARGKFLLEFNYLVLN